MRVHASVKFHYITRTADLKEIEKLVADEVWYRSLRVFEVPGNRFHVRATSKPVAKLKPALLFEVISFVNVRA